MYIDNELITVPVGIEIVMLFTCVVYVADIKEYTPLLRECKVYLHNTFLVNLTIVHNMIRLAFMIKIPPATPAKTLAIYIV